MPSKIDMYCHTDDKEMKVATNEEERIPNFFKKGSNIQWKPAQFVLLI